MRVFFLILAFCLASPAIAAPASVATSWRLLDYIAVDYREAVAGGAIINPAEYQEMADFSAEAERRIAALPPRAGKAPLLADAAALRRAIDARAAPEAVATQSRALAAALIARYPVPQAPAQAPDPARGAALYQTECAACHGATGGGDGPAAAGLDPPAIAFTDRARAFNRSLFALYQVIGQGLEETSMAAFDHLPEADRWALAFHAGTLAFTDAERAAGAALLRARPDIAADLDLGTLVGTTPADLVARYGAEDGIALAAFLRAAPQRAGTTTGARPAGLALARVRIAEAAAAYRRGAGAAAQDLALSAYLDGIEPIEPQIAIRDSALLIRIETAMADYRRALSGTDSGAVTAGAARLATLIDEAETVIGAEAAGWTASFVGAFAILLREGLEALLLVAAILLLLRKSGRREYLPYVHGGWVAALGAGGLTWLAATHLITISGASREVAEGVGGLLAAAILIWIGIWMHKRRHADAWQAAIRARLGDALSRRSAWGLFGIVFLVVYREAFETILFYTALFQQGDSGAVLAGAGTAVLALGLIAWAIGRVGRRLPLGQLFGWSAILLAALAVILAGKGLAALQEAGWLTITPLAGAPRVEWVGLFPTLEGLVVQGLALAVLLVAFLGGKRAASS